MINLPAWVYLLVGAFYGMGLLIILEKARNTFFVSRGPGRGPTGMA